MKFCLTLKPGESTAKTGAFSPYLAKYPRPQPRYEGRGKFYSDSQCLLKKSDSTWSFRMKRALISHQKRSGPVRVNLRMLLFQSYI